MKISSPHGLRISWSRGEARIYEGTNKHYSAAFTDLQNAWGETVNAEFHAKHSVWREEKKRIEDEIAVEEVMEKTVRKAARTLKFSVPMEAPYLPSLDEEEAKPYF